MTVHLDTGNIVVHHGDCIDVLREVPDSSVDAVVTDSPYGISFMGKDWDTGRQHLAFSAWCQQWATECLRALKPGGHLLAFGGTRTWHRLVTGIEDAGFEIRDAITWLYGSGFPKSLDVSKAIDKAAGATREVVGVTKAGQSSLQRVARVEQGYRANLTHVTPEAIDITAPATDAARQWDGWGTALKPASEPIVVARKPLSGTVAQTVLQHGTGALNIDASRVNPRAPIGGGGWAAHKVEATEGRDRPYVSGVGKTEGHNTGRWPANVVLSHAATPDGADLCAEGCVPGCPVADLDEQSGRRVSGQHAIHHRRTAPGGNGTTLGGMAGVTGQSYADTGGASRFFPTFRYQAKAPARERPRVDGVAHPTIKPLALMAWLIRLVCPPGGVILDPFAGSGTTLEAAVLENFRAIGIESDATYLPLIEARLHRVGVKMIAVEES